MFINFCGVSYIKAKKAIVHEMKAWCQQVWIRSKAGGISLSIPICGGMDPWYRVSQHVWNRLNVLFWTSEVCKQSELRFGKKRICSKKLLFKPFLWTTKMKMEFFSIFVPIVLCINLSSKFHEIGEKLLKNPFSVLAVFKKGWKSNFLEQNTNFFVNDARFARKHFWADSKLVGTPCRRGWRV